MIESSIIICLATDINKANDILKWQDDIHKIATTVETFTDLNHCADYVSNIETEKVFLIINAFELDHIASVLLDFSQISTMYIVKPDLDQSSRIKNQRKIKYFIKMEHLMDELMLDVKRSDHNLIHFELISDNVSQTTLKDMNNKQEAAFMFAQLLKEVFLGMTDVDRSDMIEFCRTKYADNPRQLELINRFQNDYQRHSPVWWYSLDAFLYRMLNKALRIQDISTLYALRTFIRDLHYQLLELQNTSNEIEPFVLYRGQLMPTSNFDKLRANEGGLLSINSFFSTSKNENVALSYAGSTNINTDETATLFRVTVSSIQHTNVPVARVDALSQFEEENEYLFSMGSVFRIHKIETLSNGIECVHLELTSDHDPQLSLMTSHLRQKLHDRYDLTSLGRLMWEIGNFKKAEEFYLTAMKKETVPMNMASLHNQLGTVYDDTGKHSKSLEHYEQSLAIKQSYLPPDDPSFATLQSNIGLAYQNLGNSNRALVHLKKALAIAENTSELSQERMGSIHNNIAGILDEQGQYDEALKHYHAGLQYRLACLPATHPDIAISYSDIGFLYIEQELYDEALLALNKCLEIQQNSLPPNHPSLVVTYNHITLALLKLERYQEAFEIGIKGISIATQTVGDEHEQTQCLKAVLEVILNNL